MILILNLINHSNGCANLFASVCLSIDRIYIVTAGAMQQIYELYNAFIDSHLHAYVTMRP